MTVDELITKWNHINAVAKKWGPLLIITSMLLIISFMAGFK